MVRDRRDADRARRSRGRSARSAREPIMNVMTRVRSVWNASTCRSNISFAYSSKLSGTPAGCSTTGSSRALCSSALWMRRSTSRTASRYCDSFVAIARAQTALEPRELARRPSRGCCGPLRAARRRAADRCCPVAEQALEDRARVVLHRQRRGRRRASESVVVYAQLKPASHAPANSVVSRLELERRELRVPPELARPRSDRSRCRPGNRRPRSA